MTNAWDNSSPGRQSGKIFLVGFMGSGKTYWGRIWAQAYQLAFYDLDEVIEQDQGKTVAEIFKTYGEDRFRQIEAGTLRSFSEKNNCIVACGGGTPCFHDNMQWMNEQGTTVYL
ncbi:MAG TPA: shikimate kinase, partial [Ferruginibacter sp.]|nr:shikimate kinase [Ferruginibacter sp.]